jgi:hypothetical protein
MTDSSRGFETLRAFARSSVIQHEIDGLSIWYKVESIEDFVAYLKGITKSSASATDLASFLSVKAVEKLMPVVVLSMANGHDRLNFCEAMDVAQQTIAHMRKSIKVVAESGNRAQVTDAITPRRKIESLAPCFADSVSLFMELANSHSRFGQPFAILPQFFDVNGGKHPLKTARCSAQHFQQTPQPSWFLRLVVGHFITI